MESDRTPTREQMIGFAQRSSDDAWLNSNTHTAEMFAAIANALREATPAAPPAMKEIDFDKYQATVPVATPRGGAPSRKCRMCGGHKPLSSTRTNASHRRGLE